MGGVEHTARANLNASTTNGSSGYKRQPTFGCNDLDEAAKKRISHKQREQAFEGLATGKHPRVFANAFNCTVWDIQRLMHRYTDTNSSNTIGHPRITTQCHDHYKLRNHIQHCFVDLTKTARQTIRSRQRPIGAHPVRCRLAAHNKS